MNKKKLRLLFGLLIFITIVLIILGFVFNKSDNEKLQGLTGVYDVSSDEMIVYISYEDGKPMMYLKKNKQSPQVLVQLPDSKEILDVSFSEDATSIVYVISNTDVKEDLGSTIRILDVPSGESRTVFHDPSLITEVTFDPKDQDIIFYLKAKTFENYSPIASARPHEFDVFSYQMKDDKQIRHTHLEAYTMNSLHISELEDVVFLQMMDDAESETAEDIFDAYQKVFQISLHSDKVTVISKQDREADIYDFAIVPGKQEIVFQSASNIDKNDPLFEYELYHYNWESEQEAQLTFLKEYTDRPVILPNNSVYFIVDKQFGQEYPDLHLYRMELNGENIEEILLEDE